MSAEVLPMKTLRIAFLSLCLAGAFAACSSMSVNPKAAACNVSCDEAKDKCNEKCAEEVDKNACELACKAARDKCASECKQS